MIILLINFIMPRERTEERGHSIFLRFKKGCISGFISDVYTW